MSAIMWFLYLADVVSAIVTISGLTILIIGGILVFTVPIYVISYSNGDVKEENKPFYSKVFKRLCIVLSVAIFFNVVTPSKNTVYMMLGVQVTGNLIQEASKSPITEKALQLLESKLDEAIKENTPNNQSKEK
jgi:hypothetical protein|nr:MAG TPA: hypothetical protein [Caudoviricetes sp.]